MSCPYNRSPDPPHTVRWAQVANLRYQRNDSCNNRQTLAHRVNAEPVETTGARNARA